jgi:hypothetical protein
MVLQNTLRRVPDKLEAVLKMNERKKSQAIYNEDTQRLLTEIEMLKLVFCISC